MKQLFTIEEARPRVFLLRFRCSYDLAMHFARYQEFYESSRPEFLGTSFRLLDFMAWYAKRYNKKSPHFSYPSDFAGFNIPLDIIDRVRALGIPDENHYDRTMLTVYRKVLRLARGRPAYLIGVAGKGGALDHEIAHGLYYTKPEYRRRAVQLVEALPKKARRWINTFLRAELYGKNVWVDETQAYMATGLARTQKRRKSLHAMRGPFRRLFREFAHR